MTQTPTVTFQAGIAKESLWSAAPPIVAGSGFTPVTEVKLLAACTDGSGREWISENGFLVSAQTTFDTGTTAAVGDDYYGKAAEGHIYSLRCKEGPGHDFVLPTDGNFELRYKLLDGGREAWTDNALRTTKQAAEPSGRQIAFLHNGTEGAEHGLHLLRSSGHQVQPFLIAAEDHQLDQILQSLSKLKSFHLVASGRASEAALELAQRLDNLQSVVVFSGSALRFSPWEIAGEHLDFVRCDHSSLQPRGRTVLSTRTVYAEAVADRENRNRGRIEVEKINCPLYFFSGSDDQIWPSAAFSELGAQRRGAHQLAGTTHHKTFASVGYDLGPELGLPGLPTTERTISHNSTGFRLALGGKMGRQSRARRECWESLDKIVRGDFIEF